MWRGGSVYNVARTPYTTYCKAIARPGSRPLPSALHISSPSLSSLPTPRHTPQQRTATICGSTASNLQGYDNTSPMGGRRQLSDVVDDFINLPWQKIASWASVALLATQLRDFMGVRFKFSTQNSPAFINLSVSLQSTASPEYSSPSNYNFISLYLPLFLNCR